MAVIMSSPLPPSLSGRAYSTDVDGGTPVAVRMRVAGALGRDYLGFVAERARWLSLSGWAASPSEGAVEIVAAGPEALVGALEMACVLGPDDTLVATLDLSAEDAPVAPGFVVR